MRHTLPTHVNPTSLIYDLWKEFGIDRPCINYTMENDYDQSLELIYPDQCVEGHEKEVVAYINGWINGNS